MQVRLKQAIPQAAKHLVAPHYADFDEETGKAIAKTRALQKVQELLTFGVTSNQKLTVRRRVHRKKPR
jgi:hypothetical protein